MEPSVEKLRLDKWLWHARFFKTRSLAAALVSAGGVQVNGDRIEKRATAVTSGDVLTFAQGRDVRIIRVEAIGVRRGSAPEAQLLYSDLTPPVPPKSEKPPENPAFEGKGRPTKRDRRTLDLSKARHLE